MTFTQTLILALLPTVVTAVVSFLLGRAGKSLDSKDQKIENDNEMMRNIMEGLKQLLKIQLIEYHDKYVARGSIPAYVMQNFTDLYNAYHNLGGNGTITLMFDELKKLPINKE